MAGAHLLSKLKASVIKLELIHKLADAMVCLVQYMALRGGLVCKPACHVTLVLPLLLSHLKLS